MKKFLFVNLVLVITAIVLVIFLSEVKKCNPYLLEIKKENINPEIIDYENLYEVGRRDVSETASYQTTLEKEQCNIFMQSISSEMAEKYSVGQYVSQSNLFESSEEINSDATIRILNKNQMEETTDITYISSGELLFSINVDVKHVKFITEDTVFISHINQENYSCELVSIGENVCDGQIEIFLKLYDKHADILPGNVIDVEFVVREKKDVICIPKTCLSNDAVGNFIVYRCNGETYEYNNVEIGIEDETYVEVVKGLNDGDVIIDNN